MRQKLSVVFMLLLSTILFACQSPDQASSEQANPDSQKTYIENKGSDTLVNLALAWAEE